METGITSKTKRCTACGKDKPVDAFNRRSPPRQHGLYSKCKPCMKVIRQAWHRRNPHKTTEYNHAHVARNPDRAREIYREMKQRQRSDPKRKFVMYTRTAVLNGLRGRRKAASTFDALGYTREQLITHIERQFLPGMTWKNYGRKWHLDHIVPLSAFDITSTDCPDFRVAWALTNLRPLWASDNIRKRDKRTHLL